VDSNRYVAVIQAGGKGTRMLELTNDEIPKPMLKINEKPMLQWQIENMIQYGIKSIFIITGHLGEKIEDYFKNGEDFGVDIKYIKEDKALGSAGALYYLNEYVTGKDIILVFGDVMFQLDWNKMMAFHEKKGSLATLLVHPNAHPYDSDIVILNDDCQVIGIDSKNNKRDYWYDNIVNAGIFVLSKALISSIDTLGIFDLEKDIIVPIIETKRVYGYRTPEYVKDAGTPKRFTECCFENQQGIWGEKCLSRKQKAIFIDRDGTINKYNGLISKVEQFELERNAANAIRLINKSEFLAICITNQPVVARGMCSIEEVMYIHKKMQTMLGEEGAYLDDIVFCPHHPDRGYEGENKVYKIECQCRKPKIGMALEMAEKYNIDLEKSWMIGDSTVDIQFGKNAHMKTAIVMTGQNGNDCKYDVRPDIIANDILSAVSTIMRWETEILLRGKNDN